MPLNVKDQEIDSQLPVTELKCGRIICLIYKALRILLLLSKSWLRYALQTISHVLILGMK